MLDFLRKMFRNRPKLKEETKVIQGGELIPEEKPKPIPVDPEVILADRLKFLKKNGLIRNYHSVNNFIEKYSSEKGLHHKLPIHNLELTEEIKKLARIFYTRFYWFDDDELRSLIQKVKNQNRLIYAK